MLHYYTSWLQSWQSLMFMRTVLIKTYCKERLFLNSLEFLVVPTSPKREPGQVNSLIGLWRPHDPKERKPWTKTGVVNSYRNIYCSCGLFFQKTHAANPLPSDSSSSVWLSLFFGLATLVTWVHKFCKQKALSRFYRSKSEDATAPLRRLETYPDLLLMSCCMQWLALWNHQRMEKVCTKVMAIPSKERGSNPELYALAYCQGILLQTCHLWCHLWSRAMDAAPLLDQHKSVPGQLQHWDHVPQYGNYLYWQAMERWGHGRRQERHSGVGWCGGRWGRSMVMERGE